jgi:hypothetical protein
VLLERTERRGVPGLSGVLALVDTEALQLGDHVAGGDPAPVVLLLLVRALLATLRGIASLALLRAR